MASGLSRRDFLKLTGASVAAIGVAIATPRLGFLTTSTAIDNPLMFYPNRDWESVYRDQHQVDSVFKFVCTQRYS